MAAVDFPFELKSHLLLHTYVLYFHHREHAGLTEFDLHKVFTSKSKHNSDRMDDDQQRSISKLNYILNQNDEATVDQTLDKIDKGLKDKSFVEAMLANSRIISALIRLRNQTYEPLMKSETMDTDKCENF